MKVDTLIVGFGIAGLNFAEQLRRHKKSFVVMAPMKESASHLAAGIINPTVLKRFNPVWKAEVFLDFALPLYNNLEDFPLSSHVPMFKKGYEEFQEVRKDFEKHDNLKNVNQYCSTHLS